MKISASSIKLMSIIPFSLFFLEALVSLPVITVVHSCFQSVISSLCTVLGCTDLIGNFAFTFPTRYILIQMVSWSHLKMCLLENKLTVILKRYL